MTGQRFGKLTVVSGAGKTRWNELLWLCRCDCGLESVVQGKRLRSGGTRSCGCLVNAPGHGVTHGGKYTRLYRTWSGMRNRCHNKNSKDFIRYGAAGIAVCQAWHASFAAFRDWSYANGYEDSLFIDRVDPTRGYEPSNCRWVSATESARHTRAVKLSMDAARVIRALNSSGVPHGHIAKKFGVSRSNVSLVCEGKLWSETSL